MTLIRNLLACAAILAAADSAAAMTIYSQDQAGSVGGTAVLTFTDALPAASDATLSLIATGGELNLNGKRLENLMVDGTTYQTPGQFAGWILPVNHTTGGANDPFPDPVTIPLADLSGYVADGEVQVSVTKPSFISGGQFLIRLEYDAIVPEPTTFMMATVAGLLFCGRRR